MRGRIKRILTYMLVLMLSISYLIPNQLQIVYADNSTDNTILVDSDINIYETLNTAMTTSKSLTNSNNDNLVTIDLGGHTCTLNQPFTFTENSNIYIVNGTLILNAPLYISNGASVTLCSLDMEFNTNHALYVSGEGSLLALTTKDKDTTITGDNLSYSMIRVEDKGKCIVASDKYNININNASYNTVFYVRSGQLIANSGLNISSNKNGIEVYNDMNLNVSQLNLMSNNISVFGNNTAIKIVGDSTENPTIANIFGGTYTSNNTILDIEGNSTVNISTLLSYNSDSNVQLIGLSTKEAVIKNNNGYLHMGGNVQYSKVDLELVHNTDCYLTGLGSIKNIKVTGNNNRVSLAGKDITYNKITDSGDNNIISYIHGIFETQPDIYDCILKFTTNGTDRYYIGDSITEYVEMKNWKSGDDLTVVSGNYTLPVIENLSWYGDNNQTYTTHDSSNSPATYHLLDKPCEHTTTELRNVKEPTCNELGYSGDLCCTKCNSVIQSGHSIAKLDHTITHVDSIDPTCTEPGHTEYYKCTACQAMFADEDLKEPVTETSVIIPAKGHSVIKSTGHAPTCTEEGTIDTYTCTRCNNRYKDENCTQLITDDSEIIIPTTDHNYIHHLAKEPSCGSVGNIDYYECFDCGRKIADLDHQDTEIDDVEIEALTHSCTVLIAKDPTCTEDGNIGCYKCPICNKYFEDENGQNELTAEQVIIPKLGHSESSILQENITPATCTENGSYNEVIRCTRCQEIISSTPKVIVSDGHNWSDWAVIIPATETSVGSETRTCSKCNTIETREIPQLGHTHTLQYNSAISPTCIENGNIAYYECSSCHKKYTDINATTELNDEDIIVRTTGHNLVKHDAVEAKWEDGNIEYYSCNNCDKLFDKNNNEINISDTIIKCPTFTNITITDTNGYKVALDNTSNFTVEFSKNGILKYQLQGSNLIFTPIKNGTTKILVKIGNITKQALNCTVDIHQCQHKNAIYHEGFDATCTKKGLKSYYECPDCNTYYLGNTFDEECDFNELVIDALGHIENKVQNITKEPTCTESGEYTTYTECTRCGEILQGPDTSIMTEFGHTLKPISAKSATCQKNGSIAHWKCTRCNELFSDENGIYKITESSTIVPKLNHDANTMNYVSLVKPTLTTEGCNAYYKCPYCNNYFTTDFVKTTLNDLKIAKLININTCTVSNLKAAYAWTSVQVKPAIILKNNGKTLTAGVDYTIKYSNNINASTTSKKGTITITGKGLYDGTLTKTFLIKKPILKYRSYIYKSGWEQSWITTKVGTTTSGSSYCGTKNVVLEGFQMKLSGIDGYVSYRSYIQKTGWQAWKTTTNASISGTKTNKRVERVQLKLSGQVNTLYDIYYRVYVKGKGWTGWGKNGQTVGNTLSKPITNIQVQLVPKGKKFSVTAKDLIFK